MPRISPKLPMLVISACLGPLTPGDIHAQSPRLTVEYLANEGVLLSTDSAVVLIDGLFGNGLRGYPTVPRPVRDSLEQALGRFGEIDLVLVTHVHRDHFDASAVARHLRANPGAQLAAPAQVIDSLRILAGWTGPSRTHPLVPSPTRVARFGAAGVAVEGHGIPHPAGPRNQPVDHLVWVVTVGGVRVMHTGDSSPSVEELRVAAGPGVDLLLGSSWILTGAQGAQRIAATRASQVAAIHLSQADPDVPPARAVQFLRPGQLLQVR